MNHLSFDLILTDFFSLLKTNKTTTNKNKQKNKKTTMANQQTSKYSLYCVVNCNKCTFSVNI